VTRDNAVVALEDKKMVRISHFDVKLVEAEGALPRAYERR